MWHTTERGMDAMRDGLPVFHSKMLDGKREMHPYPDWPWWTFFQRKRLKREWRDDPSNWFEPPLIYRMHSQPFFADCYVCNRVGLDRIIVENFNKLRAAGEPITRAGINGIHVAHD